MRAIDILGGAVLALALSCGGPGAQAPAMAPTGAVLRDADGRDERLDEVTARHRLHVLVFFDADCPVLKAHDERIREIRTRYETRGVGFTVVLSSAGADVAAERAAVAQRGLGMPVLEDPSARLADALGVEYSTHTVVLDRAGHVLYSGGLDSDRVHMTAGRERWLERALDAALDGRAVEKARTEPLGCPLRKH
jgi:peroxiredoxin